MNTLFRKGQAALIIVLMMVVVLTIAIATLNRTLTDVKISQQTEAGSKALIAAESGVEMALLYINSYWNSSTPTLGEECLISGSTGCPEDREIPDENSGITVTYRWSRIGRDSPSETGYILDSSIDAGDSRTIWFTDNPYNPPLGASYDGGFQVNWDPAATVEFILFYKDTANVIKLKRFLINNDSAKFFSADDLHKDASGNDISPLIMRVKPVSEDIAGVRVWNYTSSFPIQGFFIESTGKTSIGMQKKIEYTIFLPELPGAFDYVLAGKDITY